MLIAKKIRLIPTSKQENLFWKSAGVSRWSYNYFLYENEKVYNEYLANNKTGKSFAKEGEVRKYINNVLKKTTHTWLKEVGSNVMKQGIKMQIKHIKIILKVWRVDLSLNQNINQNLVFM